MASMHLASLLLVFVLQAGGAPGSPGANPPAPDADPEATTAAQAEATPAPPPPTNSNNQLQTAAALHYESGLPIVGQLLFPFGVPVTYLDVQLETENGGIVGTSRSGPNGEFRFNGVRLGSYYFIVNAAGLDYVRQALILDTQNFGAVRMAIQLRRVRGATLLDTEDIISFENLMQRKVPKDAVKAMEKGLEEQKEGDLVKAQAELEKAVRLGPEYYEAHLELGIFLHKQGQRTDAVRLLTRALELNSASRKARAVLGLAHFEMEDYRSAVDLLEESARLGNTSPDLYYLLGTAYLHLGELQLSEETLQRTIAISDGSMGESYLQLHNVYLRLRQPEKALEQLTTYLLNFTDAADRAEIQEKADALRKALNRGF